MPFHTIRNKYINTFLINIVALVWIPSAHDLPYLFPKVFTFCNKKEAATGHRASRPLVDGAEGGTEADVEASREGRLGRWRSKRARSRTLREHRTPEAGISSESRFGLEADRLRARMLSTTVDLLSARNRTCS